MRVIRDRETAFALEELQELLDRMKRVIISRSLDPTMADIPGGNTGLIVRDMKGKDAIVPVYKVDVATVTAMARVMEQAAKELGQWVERSSTENVNVDIIAILERGRERARQSALEERRRRALARGEVIDAG